MSSDPIATVLQMAQRGFSLFPVERRGKRPLLLDWPRQASQDPKQIRFWIERWPGCNWGLATGAKSGVFVLDVDGEVGLTAIRDLTDRHGHEWTATLGVKTARGGHLYFRWPECNTVIPNSVGKLAPGLDVRGEGGYVIVPPSAHPSGHIYCWVGAGENSPVALPPDWLLERVAEPVQAAKTATAVGSHPVILDGQRNATLMSLAGSMRRRGMSAEAIKEALLVENTLRCKPPLPESEVRTIASSVTRYAPRAGSTPPPTLRLVRAAEVQPEDPRWCVEPFIPQGRLSLMVSDPGAGKTWVALALAADLTRGRRSFAGTSREAASILYLSNEDAAPDLRRRIDLLGGDPTKLWLESVDGPAFVLANVGGLEEVIAERSPALVVVDTIASHFGAAADSHKANEVASVLSPLAQLAERWDAAILGLCHLTKGMVMRSLYRVQGSIAFVACARSVMAIGMDPEEPAKRILCHLKANAGPLGESHAFTLEGGVLRWVGKSDLQAGDVLGPEPSREDRCALDEAVRFLLEFLAAGPRPSKEVQAEAKAQGISWATIRRAEPKAGVERRKTGYQGQWVLELQRCSGNLKDAQVPSVSTFGHTPRC